MPETNVEDFVSGLGVGVIKKKIAHVLSEAALATVLHGNGSKKGKVGLEFSFVQVGENDQVIVSTKITQSVPTKRGKTMMEDVTDTPMFVGKGGVLTIDQPKEDNSGQFGLKQERDGVRAIR